MTNAPSERSADDELCAECSSFVDWRSPFEAGMICDECKAGRYDEINASYLDLLKRHEELVDIAKNVIEFSQNEITQDIKGRFFQMNKEHLTQEYIDSSSALKYLREQQQALSPLADAEDGK